MPWTAGDGYCHRRPDNKEMILPYCSHYSTLTIAVLLALLSLLPGGYAMNLNLACPWGDECAPPQTPYLAFYSRQSETMMFRKGEEVTITCQAGLRVVGAKWSLHHNQVEKAFLSGEAAILPGNRFHVTVPTKGLIPGFYDLRVTLDTGLENRERDRLLKRPVQGVCTFGWKADDMAIRDSRPADFKEFWQKAKAEIDAVDLDVKQETPWQTFAGKEIDAYNLESACLPGDYDPKGHRYETVESCKVSFAGPDGGRVYGWLARPKATGPFPAMLVLAGGGFNARPRPLEHARHGYLALDIQVHGQDVDLEEYPKLDGHHENQVYEPAGRYYYYNVNKRVMQAVNVLASRPDVDKTRIVAVGGSQGGRLSIMIAGVDPRITAVVAAITHHGNYPHLAWVTNCNGYRTPGDNPHTIDYERMPPVDGTDRAGAPPAVDTVVGNCLAYYDTMNFAPDIQCPVLMNCGLVDPVSPPYSVWAVYQRLGAEDKQIVIVDGHGHDWFAPFDRDAWKWLDERKE